MLALADPEREQAADDVVDPALDRLVGVGAILEEEEVGLGRAPRLLVEQQAERDPGAGLEPAQAREPRELAGDLLGERPRAADRFARRPRHRAGEAAADAGRELQPDAEPRADPGRVGLGLVLPDAPDLRGSSPSPARQRVQAATAGQLVPVAAEPTTRPKCPARRASS